MHVRFLRQAKRDEALRRVFRHTWHPGDYPQRGALGHEQRPLSAPQRTNVAQPRTVALGIAMGWYWGFYVEKRNLLPPVMVGINLAGGRGSKGILWHTFWASTLERRIPAWL